MISHLPHKQRLIIPHNQDPEAPLAMRRWVTEQKDTIALGAQTSPVRVLFLATIPLIVYAGIFSIGAGKLALADDEHVEDDLGNSQTVVLLEAVPNPGALALARGGGDIVIVDDSALLAESGPVGTLADVEESQSDRISVYVVREGDTLSQIAGMFEVSVNTIRWANDIGKSISIQEGDILIILPISGVQHAVVSGDTLNKIANKYDGDLDEIANYNGLDADASLVVGETIVVPNGEVAAPAPAPSYVAPDSSSPSPSYAGYYMRPVASGVRSQGIHGYNGVDLATYYGAEIFAAASGNVLIDRCGGWNGGYGCYSVIRHDNGSQTLYAHNSRNIVSVGQRVVQGQVIGYVGSTGRTTGSHLHFEIRGAGIRNPF